MFVDDRPSRNRDTLLYFHVQKKIPYDDNPTRYYPSSARAHTHTHTYIPVAHRRPSFAHIYRYGSGRVLRSNGVVTTAGLIRDTVVVVVIVVGRRRDTSAGAGAHTHTRAYLRIHGWRGRDGDGGRGT